MNTYSVVQANVLHLVKPDQGLILDVRTEEEHLEKHLAIPHVHIPLDKLSPTRFMNDYNLGKDAEVYILCRSGKRAGLAAEKFVSEGYKNVKVIEGGILACEKCGHIMKTSPELSLNRSQGKVSISLERQVRIVAGLLVALGSILTLAISPLFALLPLFIGLGLFFNGASGWCGMALLLAKAPWNCSRQTSSCSIPKKKL